MERKILIALIIFIVVGFLGWKIFIDMGQNTKLKEINSSLELSLRKVQSARYAKLNIDLMQKKYQIEKKNLAKKQARFIKKNDMSQVAKELRIFAEKYDLKLMDFAPLLDTYFSEMKSGRIVTLPINIAIHGRYLQIGKFIENWPQLPFYLIADEIEINRLEKNRNLLRAEIKAKLYAWNE